MLIKIGYSLSALLFATSILALASSNAQGLTAVSVTKNGACTGPTGCNGTNGCDGQGESSLHYPTKVCEWEPGSSGTCTQKNYAFKCVTVKFYDNNNCLPADSYSQITTTYKDWACSGTA